MKQCRRLAEVTEVSNLKATRLAAPGVSDEHKDAFLVKPTVAVASRAVVVKGTQPL